MRKRVAEQVLNRELRVAMLHCAANCRRADAPASRPIKVAIDVLPRPGAPMKTIRRDVIKLSRGKQNERRIARLVVELDLQLDRARAGAVCRPPARRMGRGGHWRKSSDKPSEISPANHRASRGRFPAFRHRDRGPAQKPRADELFGIHRRCPVVAESYLEKLDAVPRALVLYRPLLYSTGSALSA